MTISSKIHAPNQMEAPSDDRQIIWRHSPLLMFLLGVLSAVIASRVWHMPLADEADKRVWGLHAPNALTAPPAVLPPLPSTWRSAENETGPNVQAGSRTVILAGVSGETFAETGSTEAVLREPEKRGSAAGQPAYSVAEISYPRNLQIGDRLTLVTRSGEAQSFRVTSRRALPCVADPKKEPVSDTALLDCASGQAKTRALWEYVIEAVNTPPQQAPNAVNQPL